MKFLCLFLLFIAFCGHTQEPTHFKIGVEELGASDIYDIIQDKGGNYWISTDLGLFRHDGFSFIQTDCKEMRSNSLFGLVQDKKGNIYCYNLAHQIFRIQNNQLELIFEIPSEHRTHETSITIDTEGNLVIQAVVLFSLSAKTKKINQIASSRFTKYMNPVLALKNGVMSYESISKAYYLLKDNQIERRDVLVQKKHVNNTKVLTWFKHQNKVFAIDKFSLFAFELIGDSLIPIRQLSIDLKNNVIRPFSVGEEIWIAGQNNGVYVFNQHLQELKNGEKIFEDYFISTIEVDHEKNILLGTFKDGILVIPEADMATINFPKENSITSLNTDLKGRVLLGTNSGQVISMTKNLREINRKQLDSKAIETMLYWNERDLILIDTKEGFLTYNNQGEEKSYSYGSLKDGVFINETECVLAFNTGLFRFEFKGDQLNFKDTLWKGRIYTIDYCAKTNSLFAGTASGLVIIDSKESKKFKMGSKIVYANDVVSSEGELFVATKNYGILVFYNNHLKRKLEIEQQVIKMEVHNGKCYFLTNDGFFVSDLFGNNVQKMGVSVGLMNKRIYDFKILEERIYFVQKQSIQSIKLNQLITAHNVLPIAINAVKINDIKSSNKRLSSDERKVEFIFGIRTLKHREEVNYEYRLVGYDDKWKRQGYLENSVVYSALSPGRYRFEVRSEHNGKFSQPKTYSFTIAAPFYETWWFYLFILMCVVAVLYYFFRRRLRIQQREAERRNELNASKLTAIQSQMNPHFIFNSLNSIQSLILKEDTEKSYDYIVLFAQLVRNTLNYSEREFISIQEEVKFLEVYLSLEKLRFGDDFNYHVEYSGNREILVPSMLIQPFVENASVHGLMHKAGKKNLSVKFELKDHLTCTIEDNGVGREQVKVILDRQRGEHKSFAIQAIKKRLQILNEKLGQDVGKYEFVDLYQDDSPAGTKVIVTIPFRENNHFTN